MPEQTRVDLLIQRARQRKRMTQRQLAAAVGVHPTSVKHWEAGTHYPLRHAGAIEAVLDIKLPEREAVAS